MYILLCTLILNEVKLNIIKKSEETYARALALEQSYNNNPDTNTDFYEESSESDKDSDSDEEKQEKSPVSIFFSSHIYLDFNAICFYAFVSPHGMNVINFPAC
jgi:hypothetical protein